MSASMLRLLGKVWPVGGPLLVRSQRGKGPFGVGGNRVTTTRAPVNPVPAHRGSAQISATCPGWPWISGKGFAVAFAPAFAFVVACSQGPKAKGRFIAICQFGSATKIPAATG